MKVKLTTITPEQAFELLDQNTNNRNLSRQRVSRYARDMKAGEWRTNCDPVRVAVDGTLLDGQHRLWACIEAEKPFEVVLVTGLPRDVIGTIDTGRPRAFKDALAINGLTNSTNTAAATRAFMAIAAGPSNSVRPVDASIAELQAVLDAHPQIHDSVRVWTKPFGVLTRSRSMLIAWHVYLSERFPQKEVDDFFERLTTGYPVSGPRDPVICVRDLLLKSRGMQVSQRLRVLHCLLAIKAWNYEREGREMRLAIIREPDVPGFYVAGVKTTDVWAKRPRRKRG